MAPQPQANVARVSHPAAVEFFTGWFEAHRHTDVIVDQQGVGVGTNATRLSATLYGSKQQDDGGYVVEMEFRVLLSAGREMVEFVAGLGDSEAAAIDDALLNFMLTTFHVVYKGFINADDPHIEIKQLTLAGQPRELIAGDIYLRGGTESKTIDLNVMRPLIEAVLSEASFTAEPHWVKIVYSRIDNKPGTVSVTVDNEEATALTAAITALDWPASREFYMAKQFLVIK